MRRYEAAPDSAPMMASVVLGASISAK